MSEQPAAPAAGEPPRPGAKGRKILGMSRGQAAGLGVVAVGGLLFLLWRARKNAAAAQQAATPSTCPDGSTPDANGNCPQNSADFSGALETLQSEIAALQGAGAGGGSSGGDGSAGTVAGSTGTTTTPAAGTTTTAPGSTTTAPKPAGPKTAGPVSNIQVTATRTTGFAVRWNAAQNATGYAYVVRDLASHTQVKSGQTPGTSVAVEGLKSKTDYNFGVQGLPGGQGNNIHVRTK